MIQANQGPWGGGGAPTGGPPGGYGPPPGGGGYNGPPGGGGYGGPPGGGGFGGPPGGGGFGGPPGGGYGGPPGGGGFGAPPGGFGGGPPPPYVPQTPGGPMPTGAKTDALAILSLALGICSLPGMFCCSFFGIPLSLAAIIMGLIAISNINKKPQELTGKGLAIGGIASGSIGLVLLVILLIGGVGGAILQSIL